MYRTGGKRLKRMPFEKAGSVEWTVSLRVFCGFVCS